MADNQQVKLLTEALASLNDTPRFRLRCDRSRDSYKLAARIEAYLAGLKKGKQAIAEARRRWALSGFIRVDPDEMEFDETADGHWVRGWIKIGGGIAGKSEAQFRAKYEEAVSALPIMTREVFDAHRLENENYEAIAMRLGLGRAEVETLIGEALFAISRALLPSG